MEVLLQEMERFGSWRGVICAVEWEPKETQDRLFIEGRSHDKAGTE